MMREIAYSKQGDYLLPNLTVPDEPEVHLGKYGSLRRNYLKEQHYGIFLSLLTQGKLNQHLKETQEEAQGRMEQIVAEMAKAEEVTEETEKIQALRLLCQRYAPENMAGFQAAVEKSLGRTAVWKIAVQTITGKANR